MTGRTVVVAVKSDCDGCRSFYDGSLEPLRKWTVLLVGSTVDGELAQATNPIIESSKVLEDLGVRWPPYYVVVDANPGRVVAEGIAFTPAQVADEVTSRGL